MAKHSSRDARFKKQRLRVLARDNWTCIYCGGPANEADHVIAKVKGGDDSMENLVSACRMCNNRKGKKPQAVFLGQTATPLVSPSSTSPKTVTAGVKGPCMGQARQFES